MRHFLIATPLALTLSFGTAAMAQQTTDAPPATQGEHHHHAPNPQKQAAFLTKKLNLTADQSAKIEPILADRDQKVEALHTNQALSEQDRHEQMRAINQQTEQQMSTILTPDQMTQLKAMRRGHEHHGSEQGGDANQSPSM